MTDNNLTSTEQQQANQVRQEANKAALAEWNSLELTKKLKKAIAVYKLDAMEAFVALATQQEAAMCLGKAQQTNYFADLVLTDRIFQFIDDVHRGSK